MSYQVSISGKRGFYAPNVKVYTVRDGVLFYDNTTLVNSNGKFNLPKGDYIFTKRPRMLSLPLKYKIPKLPKKERSIKRKNYKVKYGTNDAKCTVDHLRGVILMDESFLRKPKYIRAYIIGHEYGHRHYYTESKCDAYAEVKMLREGYNPSQILLANTQTIENDVDNIRQKKSLKRNGYGNLCKKLN